MGFREIRSEDFDAHSMQKQRFRIACSPQSQFFSPPAVTHRSYIVIIFVKVQLNFLCKLIMEDLEQTIIFIVQCCDTHPLCFADKNIICFP